ncbi:hypothetical protein CATRI_12280 [Corynebacterium atrinae]|nr:hypothetical protein CATRI_12280 [Corynebacterium atrinae]
MEPEDYEAIMADPIAAQYVRPFVGAKELIHGLPRWCLWISDSEVDKARKSPVVAERLAQVTQFRSASKKAGTRALAAIPHQFGERRQPTHGYVCIPRHFSETRDFATVKWFNEGDISGDANFTADDPDGFLFAIISSLMFMTWQRLVGGRLKSDLRFSNTLVWNTFPLPTPSVEERTSIVKAGQHIVHVRSALSDGSLANIYSKTPLDDELRDAHFALDAAVDRLFNLDMSSIDQRERALIKSYLKLSQ